MKDEQLVIDFLAKRITWQQALDRAKDKARLMFLLDIYLDIENFEDTPPVGMED